MCLAVPGKILKIEGEYPLKMAEVDFIGLTRMVCIGAVDANVGDYVIVHAGTAISIIDPEEAINTICDLKLMTDYSDEKFG